MMEMLTTSGSQHFNVAFANRHALFAAKDL